MLTPPVVKSKDTPESCHVSQVSFLAHLLKDAAIFSYLLGWNGVWPNTFLAPTYPPGLRCLVAWKQMEAMFALPGGNGPQVSPAVHVWVF